MYERLIGYINHVTVEEYSLFGECGMSILKFVNPVFLKTNDGNAEDDAGDDGNGVVAKRKTRSFVLRLVIVAVTCFLWCSTTGRSWKPMRIMISLSFWSR